MAARGPTGLEHVVPYLDAPATYLHPIRLPLKA
jgi:hypothetical protein